MPGPKACVIGWPVAHSRSPLIHGHWLARYQREGTYEKIAVSPERLPAFVGAMRADGYVGGNITVPHKEAMAALCTRLLPAARRTHSVNTVWFEDDVLCGDSTDGAGFAAALDQEAPGWDRDKTHAVVLGAGGAARAVVDALQQRGFSAVTVASRTPARGLALAHALNCQWMKLGELPDRLGETTLLVNTTPAGMAGQEPLVLDLTAMNAKAVVNDIVYVPRETPLLRDARARGLRTVGGLGMLLHQAAPGFERWFGVRPDVTPALRAVIETDIATDRRSVGPTGG